MDIKIYTNFNLNIDDIRTLGILYLPLIGDDAYALYTFMHSILDKTNLKSETFTKEEILDILGYKTTAFNKALAKLEALNLVRTFMKEDLMLILLLTPFTPKNFLKDTILGSYLEAKVGSTNFNKIVELFKIPPIDLKEYKEITKTFAEVFGDERVKFNKVDLNITGRRPNHKNLISNFDFDLFVSKIDVDLIKEGIDEDFKKKIESTCFVYGYNLEQMTNLFNDSIKDGFFNFDLFKKKAQSLYNFLNKNNENIISENKENDLANKLDNMTPISLLESLIGKDYPTILLQKINELYINIDMPKGVINMMIIDVYSQKETIPSLSYFQKMASSWQNYGILTTYDAVLKFMQTKEINNKTKKSNHKKDIELEDWQIAGMANIMKGFGNNE